jgi:hypothetical protein
MPLLTDSDISSLDDLLAIDGEIGDVGATENITITGQGGIIRQSWSECKNELLESQQQYSVGYWGPWDLLSVGNSFSAAPRILASQIVTGTQYSADTSWVKTWMAYRALLLFYSSAANRKAKDRYQLKADKYAKCSNRHWCTVVSNGLPIAFQPLECPGAIHGYSAGIWSASGLSAVSGGAGAGGMVDVALTYVDQSKYVSSIAKNNAESGPSAIADINLGASQFLQVSIAALSPPSTARMMNLGRADGVVTSLLATGWNIYAGPSGGVLTLQNVAPIPIGTATYTFTAQIGNTGPVVAQGQYADRNLPLTKQFNRG